MLDQMRVTDALPVVSVVCLTPADFQDIPYSPALLLSSRFDASITSDAEFHTMCEVGFDSYFDEMYQHDGSGNRVFVDRFYAPVEMKRFIVEDVCAGVGRDGQALACCVGFWLGWLSALALTDQSSALVGLEVVTSLAVCLQGRAVC